MCLITLAIGISISFLQTLLNSFKNLGWIFIEKRGAVLGFEELLRLSFLTLILGSLFFIASFYWYILLIYIPFMNDMVSCVSRLYSRGGLYEYRL